MGSLFLAKLSHSALLWFAGISPSLGTSPRVLWAESKWLFSLEAGLISRGGPPISLALLSMGRRAFLPHSLN